MAIWLGNEFDFVTPWAAVTFPAVEMLATLRKCFQTRLLNQATDLNEKKKTLHAKKAYFRCPNQLQDSCFPMKTCHMDSMRNLKLK